MSMMTSQFSVDIQNEDLENQIDSSITKSVIKPRSISKDEPSRTQSKTLIKIMIVSIAFALTLQLIAVVTFNSCLYRCGPRKLMPTCRFGFCVEANMFSPEQIEDSIDDLERSKIQALILDYNKFVNEKGQNLLRKLNRHGIVGLLKLKYSSAMKSLEILNNGYIITGSNYEAIKLYDWKSIKKMKKELDYLSHVKTCMYIEIKTASELKLAHDEKFDKRMELCGFIYSEAIVSSAISNYDETKILPGDIVMIDARTKNENDIMRYTPMNSSFSLRFDTLDIFAEITEVFSRAHDFRKRMIPLIKRGSFKNVTVNSLSLPMKPLRDPSIRTNYEMVVIPPGTSEINVKSIDSNAKSWKFLLAPQKLDGNELSELGSDVSVSRENDQEYLVVILYK